MSMLTQCPNCQTTFRVTSEILRVADGQVRCGRCQTQFDALERLLDESDVSFDDTGHHAQPRTSSATGAHTALDDPAAHEDVTLEGRHIEISGRYRVDEDGDDQPQIREESVEEWVEIEDVDAEEPAQAAEADPIFADEDEDDDEDEEARVAAAEDDREPLDAVEEIERFGAETDEQADSDEPFEEPEAAEARSPLHSFARHQGAQTDAAVDDLDLLPPAARARDTARIWKILAGPLALLLTLQLVHNYRSSLARHPQLGPAVVGLYDMLGLTLKPDWDLHAYEILQWHVGSDPVQPGTLKVRASIKNVARFAQPYPMLRLVLEDRWGEQVRAREFQPAEYLDPATVPNRLLAPAQQTTATISIVDPGPDAEGFRFDVCLPGTNGTVCAAEVPPG
ncbi:MAG: DUF3426 domain-containing protein [Steroidobacteraceae bacterium]